MFVPQEETHVFGIIFYYKIVVEPVVVQELHKLIINPFVELQEVQEAIVRLHLVQ